ncbi:MAG: SUMF1/EgtB/PvdO family nonheme iron enzyme [Proteobacteria bacterium]|nr:SUMF1/EgtB/PvdO family nonheme iron enzyme [Pseudomonadota bacterium]
MTAEKIGGYEILDTLGSGGFGIVYKAHADNGVIVAIKVLNREALDNEKVVKKFFHEAMILAKLHHPNITKLVEFFPADNAYAIVMEYVEGTTLKDLLKNQQGPLPFEKAQDLCRQILSAFHYAHLNGIIHRDIKPGNIMIDNSGQVKIMDFGIAKISSAAGSETRTTWRWGAPHYMAPERFREEGVLDARSDIYSLGVVFHEAFAGRRPFESGDTITVISCHLNELPKPLETYAPAVPKRIGQAIMKALEKDPDHRFNTCEEFSKALESGEIEDGYTPGLDEEDATVVVNEDVSGLFHASPATPGEAASGVAPARQPAKKPKSSRKSIGLAMGLAALVLTLALGVVFRGPIANLVRNLLPGSPQINRQGMEQWIHPVDGAMMILVPEGEFTMGSDTYADEEPVQRILLGSYYLDRDPVTNERFRAFVATTGYVTDAEKKGFGMARRPGRWEKVPGASWRTPDGVSALPLSDDNLPVVQVSYNDALAYCRWAGKDLPTEAQWEKAARGVDGNLYAWGNDPPSPDVADYGHPGARPAPVDQYAKKGASAYGMNAMAGSVRQWCKGWYSPGVRDYRDPKGPREGKGRVVKGGSFAEGPESLRVASRDRYEPDFACDLIGFRCAAQKVTQ